jgi:hypothetical protein
MRSRNERRDAGAGDRSRSRELDYEWDFDRTVETEASVMGLLGLALRVAVNRRFLVLPAIVFASSLSTPHRGGAPASGVSEDGRENPA